MAKRVTRVPITHAVQKRDHLAWVTNHEGSAPDCESVLALCNKHFPDREHRVVTIAEAKADKRRKTWSVSDADNIPKGSEVALVVMAGDLHPSLVKAAAVFGLDPAPLGKRRGVVKSRHRRYGTYMVSLTGTPLTVTVKRSDLIFPVPDNMLMFERTGRRRRPS